MMLEDFGLIIILLALVELAAFCRQRGIRNVDWLVILIVLLITSGCQTLRPPASAAFWEIVSEPYALNKYDCSNKSSKYARILREKGYQADILIVSVEDGYHAIVQVMTRDGYVYCDPTNGEYSRDLSDYGELRVFVPYESRLDEERWGDAFIEGEGK